jgi:hypothetical protein
MREEEIVHVVEAVGRICARHARRAGVDAAAARG